MVLPGSVVARRYFQALEVPEAAAVSADPVKRQAVTA